MKGMIGYIVCAACAILATTLLCCGVELAMAKSIQKKVTSFNEGPALELLVMKDQSGLVVQHPQVLKRAYAEAMDSYRKVLTPEEFKASTLKIEQSSLKRIGEAGWNLEGTMNSKTTERSFRMRLELIHGELVVVYIVASS